jgi:hypothetical protein
MEDKSKKIRSPQFPFISLQKAVERATVFEAEYHQHSARATLAAKVWGYAEKSSGGIQTIAALVAYGLMTDEGSLENRELTLSQAAMTILKDARSGAAAAAIKAAALTPKALADLWTDWRNQRPPTPECISTLHQDKQFSEDAATRLLEIYDANIKYAGLDASDKISPEEAGDQERESDDGKDKRPDPKRHQRPQTSGEVQLMENERVLYAHQNGPSQGFRLVVTGDVDKSLISVLKAFVEFQEKILSKPNETSSKEEKST